MSTSSGEQIVDKNELLDERRARQRRQSGGPVSPVQLLSFYFVLLLIPPSARRRPAASHVVHLARAVRILFSKLRNLSQYRSTACAMFPCVNEIFNHSYRCSDSWPIPAGSHAISWSCSFQVAYTGLHTDVDFPILSCVYHTVIRFHGTLAGQQGYKDEKDRKLQDTRNWNRHPHSSPCLVISGRNRCLAL